MDRSRFSLHQAVASALIVVGAIAICAICFNYTGKIHFEVGADGIQL
jgi:hypothetical protein